jgi:hypothetical protein
MHTTKTAIAALILLLFAWPAFAQTITVQPVSQTVQAGQTASFSVTETGYTQVKWCSYPPGVGTTWTCPGSTTFVSGTQTLTYTTPPTTLAMSGTQYKLTVLYPGGYTYSAAAKLTVVPGITASVSALYDDGTIPTVEVDINQVVTNPDGTTTATPVLVLTPDPTTGQASGTMVISQSLSYQTVLWVNNIAVANSINPGALILAMMPQISQVNFSVVLFKATGLVKSFSSGAS